MRGILVIFLVFSLVPIGQAYAQSQSGFYYERERGWFWHEPDDELAEEDESVVEEQGISVLLPEDLAPEKRERIPLDVAWLRENIEALQIRALENPSTENVAAFAYAQRLMLDISSRFSTAMMEFMAMEPELDESQRRPTSTLSLNVFKKETAQALTQTIQSLNESAHIWFFYTSDCPYCMQQLPIVREFARRYNLDILAVSLDGGVLRGSETMETVFDIEHRVATMFGLEFTPSLVLAKTVDDVRDSDFTILSQGLITLPDLERITLIAARDMGAITSEQYALTTEVRDINVLRNEDGVLEADADLLENDPGYLAELLRARLREMNSPVGARALGGSR